jgi:hypothetical protein
MWHSNIPLIFIILLLTQPFVNPRLGNQASKLIKNSTSWVIKFHS